MSLTAEQITAQNFKNFYDRIRPLLSAQHYHVDRSGQELKTLYAGFSTDPADTDDQKYWTGVANTSLPFIKISGDFEMANSIITIPAYTKVKLDVSLSDETATSNTLYAWYDADTNTQLNLKQLLPYATSNRPYSASGTWIWENNTDNEKHITFKLISFISAPKLRYRFCSMTVHEIGRIVDPIQYMSSGDNLEETPVGNIITYMGNNVPKHYLTCDGTTYSIGSYPELEAHFIAEFGSVNYFGGDGTSTFAVPDLRGEFLRGTGTNSHENQGSGANVGIHQDGTATPSVSAGYDGLYINNIPASGTNGSDNIDLGYKKNASNRSASVNIAGTWSTTANNMTTSRPTNTSVQYCIKYETTYHVIVPSHAYKVKVKATISSNTNTYSYQVLDSSDVLGDVSLIDGNYFVAPIDGWYSLSLQGSTSGLGTQNFGIEIAGDPTKGAWNSGIGCPSVIYLEKGQKVRMYSYGSATTHTCYLNFCLLTSNYNENIIAGGEVYSENEQEIGTWLDGKKLYQKSVSITFPNNDVKNVDVNISNVENIVKIFGYAKDSRGNVISVPFHMDSREQRGGIFCYIVDSTTVRFVLHSNVDATGFSGYATIQYTKSTDQANTYTYKNSLLLTRPDLWTPNTEIDFGGGLYGYRAKGNFTATPSGSRFTIEPIQATANTRIVSSGGCVSIKNGVNDSQMMSVNGITCDSTGETLFKAGWWYNLTTSCLRFGVGCTHSSISLTTSNTYDVWVTYVK